MTAFNTWLATLIDEKGYDREQRFEVEGPSGTNSIPLGCVEEAIKLTTRRERRAIQNRLVQIDFHNGDCLDYFRHLAQALAQ